MKDIIKLQQEHSVFRTQLASLEATMAKGTGTWRSWRDIGFSISHDLRAHVRSECGAAAYCARRLGTLNSEALETFAIDHDEQWRILQLANEYLARVIYVPDTYVGTILGKFVAAFRAAMDRQEAELFPLINRVFEVQEDPNGAAIVPGALLDNMTANQVIKLYPETRAVFERLCVNMTYEGFCSLDHLAWNHGITDQALITLLETEIGRQQVPDASNLVLQESA